MISILLALALQGDALRRSGNPDGARLAYLGALQASPLPPRAAYGVAHAVGGAVPGEHVLRQLVEAHAADRRNGAVEAGVDHLLAEPGDAIVFDAWDRAD